MKNNMKDLSFILPIHEYDKNLINNVIDNLAQFENEVIIVAPQDVCEKIESEYVDDEGIRFVVNDGETDFCSQVNLGVKNCETSYFTIVEFDDEFYGKWMDNLVVYSDAIESDAYLTITELMDVDKKIVSLANELAWSTSFVDDLGYIDADALNNFYDFSIVGGVFKKDDFIKIGGLKPSLDIAACYEFLMRFINNGLKIYVIPKIGYRHMVGRDGSFIMNSKNRISQKKGEWLIETAKEEMKYNEEREITFSE